VSTGRIVIGTMVTSTIISMMSSEHVEMVSRGKDHRSALTFESNVRICRLDHVMTYDRLLVVRIRDRHCDDENDRTMMNGLWATNGDVMMHNGHDHLCKRKGSNHPSEQSGMPYRYLSLYRSSLDDFSLSPPVPLGRFSSGVELREE
jgi:hypothetical protein